MEQKNVNFKRIELVIILDGKNDFVKEFIDHYFEGKIQTKVLTTKNQGLTKALNVGLKACEGEFIARIDCDDEWLPDKLSTQLLYLKHNPDLVLLGTGWENVDSFQRILSVSNRKIERSNIKKELAKYNFFNHSSVIFHKKTINKIGGYNEKYKYAQDYILWAKILSLPSYQNRVHILEDVCVTREHAQSGFEKKSQQLLASCHARLMLMSINSISFSFATNLIKSFLGYLFLKSLHLLKLEGLYKKLIQNDYFHGPVVKSNYFEKISVKGYLRDFRLKFLDYENYEKIFIKQYFSHNQLITHPVTICQTALGIYELFLRSDLKFHKDRFIESVELLIENSVSENDELYWEVPLTFKLFNLKKNFVSGLVQGQAVSVFLRAHLITGDFKYITYAEKAFKKMLLPIEEGGCSRDNEKIIEEYPNKYEMQTVLNGLIYSIVPMYEMYLVTNNENYLRNFEKSISQLESDLHHYDAGYWSRYSIKTNSLSYNNLASPYYHNEHILQLEVLYQITNREIFKEYSNRWNSYKNNRINLARVFFSKLMSRVFQKFLIK